MAALRMAYAPALDADKVGGHQWDARFMCEAAHQAGWRHDESPPDGRGDSHTHGIFPPSVLAQTKQGTGDALTTLRGAFGATDLSDASIKAYVHDGNERARYDGSST